MQSRVCTLSSDLSSNMHAVETGVWKPARSNDQCSRKPWSDKYWKSRSLKDEDLLWVDSKECPGSKPTQDLTRNNSWKCRPVDLNLSFSLVQCSSLFIFLELDVFHPEPHDKSIPGALAKSVSVCVNQTSSRVLRQTNLNTGVSFWLVQCT
jgi:hypothetical protein